MKNWLRHGAAPAGLLAGAALGGPNSDALVAVDLQPQTPEIDSVGTIAGSELTVRRAHCGREKPRQLRVRAAP